MDRPLRIVGEQLDNLRGEPRRSVVLQTRHHMVVLCNARCACCFSFDDRVASSLCLFPNVMLCPFLAQGRRHSWALVDARMT